MVASSLPTFWVFTAYLDLRVVGTVVPGSLVFLFRSAPLWLLDMQGLNCGLMGETLRHFTLIFEKRGNFHFKAKG